MLVFHQYLEKKVFFFLLYVLMLWILVIVCVTRVQGEFEKFPPYLHCHYLNILINLLFILAKYGCEKSCLTESMP